MNTTLTAEDRNKLWHARIAEAVAGAREGADDEWLTAHIRLAAYDCGEMMCAEEIASDVRDVRRMAARPGTVAEAMGVVGG